MIERLKNKLKKGKRLTLYALITRYVNNQVGSRAASLAYYLLFSLFPLLILIASIIGLLNIDPHSIDPHSIGTLLSRFLPTGITKLAATYLEYIQQSYNSTIMVFSIVFSIWFPFRAIKGLMRDVRRSFDLDETPGSKLFIIRQIICTLLLPTTILLSLILIVLGQNVIESVLHLFLPGTIHLNELLIELWQYLRFVAAALLMGFSIGVLYELSLDKFLPFRNVLPGIVFVLVVWVVSSILFSVYVEHYANYSLIYGTLGAFIVLMLWLYLTSLIFIMGSELNAVLLERSKQKDEPIKTLQ